MFMNFAAMMPAGISLLIMTGLVLPEATLQLNNTNTSLFKNFQQKVNMNFGWVPRQGLVLLNTDTKQFRFIASGGYYAYVLEIVYDPENKKVFISTETGKLFTYDETENKYSEIFANEAQYPSTSFFQPEENEIWMPSEKGLIKISNDRKKIRI